MPEMRVKDIVLHQCRDFGTVRMWEIEAIGLGGCGQENLVRLRSLCERPGRDENGTLHVTTVVPETLLRDLELFSRVRAGEPRSPAAVEDPAVGAGVNIRLMGAH